MYIIDYDLYNLYFVMLFKYGIFFLYLYVYGIVYNVYLFYCGYDLFIIFKN